MAVITYDQVFSNTDITELDRGGLAKDLGPTLPCACQLAALSGCLCFHVYATLTTRTGWGNLGLQARLSWSIYSLNISSTLLPVLANKQSARLHVLPKPNGLKSEIDVSCCRCRFQSPFSPYPSTCQACPANLENLACYSSVHCPFRLSPALPSSSCRH